MGSVPIGPDESPQSKSVRAFEFAQARINPDSREATNINDIIAALTSLRIYAEAKGNTTLQKEYGQKAGVYTFLREQFEVQTLGEALRVISAGSERISESVVGLWIDEGLLKERLEIEAVEMGFPHLRPLLYERAYEDVSLDLDLDSYE